MNEMISIIIPAYNIEKYIGPCLDSILVQTYRNLEIIVVDDGSTDQTGMICDSFCKKDARIKVIHKENEGVSLARNKGIEASSGTYLCFFDGDDFIEPNTCEDLIESIKREGADALIYGYFRYKDGSVTEICPPIFPTGNYQGEQIIQRLLSRFIGFSNLGIHKWLRKEKNALYVENPALWRIMLKRNLVVDHKLLFERELKVGEDTIFISQALSYAQKCHVCSNCYYYLVSRDDSTISQYEKDPLGKLEGKKRLLDARFKISKEIQERTGYDISPYWQGTVVMSAVEMAFLLAGKNSVHNFWERYQLFLGYVRDPRVRSVVAGFPLPENIKIMSLPFYLLKRRLYFMLFLAAWMLHLVNYEFQRN